jgi:hypothetical protein
MAVASPSYFYNVVSCTYGSSGGPVGSAISIFGVKKITVRQAQGRLDLRSPTNFAPINAPIIDQSLTVNIDTDDGVMLSLPNPSCGDDLIFIIKAPPCSPDADTLPDQLITIKTVVWNDIPYDFNVKSDHGYSRSGFALAQLSTGLPSFVITNA